MNTLYINRVELQGRVGTVRISPVHDTIVANFSVMTEHMYETSDGNKVVEATWMCCSLRRWRGQYPVTHQRIDSSSDRKASHQPVYRCFRMREGLHGSAGKLAESAWVILVLHIICNELEKLYLCENG